MSDDTEFSHLRVEKSLVRPGDANFKASSRLCQITRRLKNRTHYLLRNVKNLKGGQLSHRDADKILKTFEPQLYHKLPSALAQRNTQIAGQEWAAFYAALRRYNKHPERFEARPKPPGYAHRATTTYIGRNGFCVKDGYLHFPRVLGLVPVKTRQCQDQPYNSKKHLTRICEVRVVPRGSCFQIEVVYDHSRVLAEGAYCPLLSRQYKLGIDIGLNNLIAMVTNQPGRRPVLVNGRVIKSINALYNKHAAQLRARNKKTHLNAKAVKRLHRLNDYLHKVSRFVVNYCLAYEIGVIVMGKNEQWKTELNIGKVNNQNFISVPHARLLDMIEYKAKENGIKVVIREESYTSKASALDKDPLPSKGDTVLPVFSGRRVKRGLYKTQNGQFINADINGALNILRKEFTDEALALPGDRGLVTNPVLKSFHNVDCPKVFGTRRNATQQAGLAA